MNTETAQQVFRLAAYCLQYPDEQWMSSFAELREAVQEIESAQETAQETAQEAAMQSSSRRGYLLRFLQAVEQMDGNEWQELYVQTFDFGKRTNLYLTYAGHGEERERGPALLEIKKQYEDAGFLMVDGELPDYLPLMLEYASVASPGAAVEMLQAHVEAIAGIRDELAKINSPYTLVLDAVLDAMGDAAGDVQRGGAGI